MAQSKPIRLVVHGAAGRMGRRIVAVAALDGIWNLVAAIERSSHPLTGEDSGLLAGTGSNKVTIASQWHEAADVIIDFSLPGAVAGIAAVAAEKKIPLVVATTGLGPVDRLAIESASTTIPVLESPSMSLAVNVALDLVARAGRLLVEVGGRCDVEILEWHHRHKEDAPSGTALAFGKRVTAAMGQSRASHGREGRPGARPADEIGYHAIRAGDNPGEHTILFGMEGESLSVAVRATNRDCYARGALAAAEFLVGKPAGLYSMRDVLGLSD
ncbi:MAG: 4-hydroxy-tetrahydrodipicolinate reductase [Planctomycetota bacterium]|nr:MAG: 4-hydroxy-tetrahydrodipicolinate reductase [Planctomycetota bacterium]